jgi:hypothetical protein
MNRARRERNVLFVHAQSTFQHDRQVVQDRSLVRVVLCGHCVAHSTKCKPGRVLWPDLLILDHGEAFEAFLRITFQGDGYETVQVVTHIDPSIPKYT